MLRLPTRFWTSAVSAIALCVAATVPAAADDDGVWLQITTATPAARASHTAVYDSARNRMIVFGGIDQSRFNDVKALSLSVTDPMWADLSPAGTPPSPRFGHVAIYDPVRDQMIVFGGNDGTQRNDVWALSLSGTPTWTQLSPAGSAPSGRVASVAIYDPNGDRMIVFGGEDNNFRNDVWALSLSGTPTWTDITPVVSGPTARGEHTAIYDPVRSRMVVYGGTSGLFLNDIWALSLTGTPAWSQISPPSAGPLRAAHTAVYDPVGDRMVIFGGGDFGSSARNDVWALSLASPAWTQLAPSGSLPGGRGQHVAVYDPASARMVVFGGLNFLSIGDVWSLSLSGSPAWTFLGSQGAAIPGRYAHSAIRDPIRKRMIVFGGRGPDGNLRNDVWALSLTGIPAWTQLTPSGSPPSPRAGHAAIYDPVRDRMIVFAGSDGFAVQNDVWALSLSGTPTWTQLTPLGTPPAGRIWQSAVYDPIADALVVFGGSLEFGEANDLWQLSFIGTPTWTQVVPAGTPPPARREAGTVYDTINNRMLIFSGASGTSTILNDVWALALPAGTPTWTELTPPGTPTNYLGHTAIFDPVRNRMVAFEQVNGPYADGAWSLYLSALPPVWAQLAPSGTAPTDSVISLHTAIHDSPRDRMIVFGGYPDLDKVWALNWGQPLTDVPRGPVASSLKLAPPYPNPARGALSMAFTLSRAGQATLDVFDVRGRRLKRVENSFLEAGSYSRRWDGTSDAGAAMPGGIYFIRLTCMGSSAAQRLVLMR